VHRHDDTTALDAVALALRESEHSSKRSATSFRVRDSHSSHANARPSRQGVYTLHRAAGVGGGATIEGTREEHTLGETPQNAQNAATRLRRESPVNRQFRRDATSMVRKGSPVRVRQRALKEPAGNGGFRRSGAASWLGRIGRYGSVLEALGGVRRCCRPLLSARPSSPLAASGADRHAPWGCLRTPPQIDDLPGSARQCRRRARSSWHRCAAACGRP
jgi:hypothetical protein